jgi:pimeloyl-ACP methyl ester carboxylesterase/class 3 adenylate cyclase
MQTETRYAKVGDIHVAYQTVGTGPVDIVCIPGIFTHVEWLWEEPSSAAYLRELAGFARLILFDPRGLGLSDRSASLPTLEEQIDDVTAVLDAVGSETPYVFGASQGGLMAMLFAATHPSRTRGLILYSAYPTARADGEYPWGRSSEWLAEYTRQIDSEWGSGAFAMQVAPSRSEDDAFRSWWGKLERFAAGPGNAIAYARMNMATDVRPVLDSIAAPTLVLHRRGDLYRDVRIAHYLAENIPNARLAELSGIDHLPYVGDSVAVIREIRGFVTGARDAKAAEIDRELATVVFVDIVGSTDLAREIGDSRWSALLDQFLGVVRAQIGRWRGVEIDAAGDGVLARFDGPARGLRFALGVRAGVSDLGLQIRAGVHTGEVVVYSDGIRGIAVHLAARIASEASPSEVLASTTVRDLVAGSGLSFADRGRHALKGLEGDWQLFAAEEGTATSD